jgi:hypothetical protein
MTANRNTHSRTRPPISPPGTAPESSSEPKTFTMQWFWTSSDLISPVSEMFNRRATVRNRLRLKLRDHSEVLVLSVVLFALLCGAVGIGMSVKGLFH